MRRYKEITIYFYFLFSVGVTAFNITSLRKIYMMITFYYAVYAMHVHITITILNKEKHTFNVANPHLMSLAMRTEKAGQAAASSVKYSALFKIGNQTIFGCLMAFGTEGGGNSILNNDTEVFYSESPQGPEDKKSHFSTDFPDVAFVTGKKC